MTPQPGRTQDCNRAQALGRLLDIKDGAHYGMVFVGAPQAKTAIRHATTLVTGAAQLLDTY